MIGTAAGSPAGTRSDVPAKFAVPVATHVVARPRLHAALSAGLASPVTLLAATAGWGKTLLVGSWIAGGAGGRPVAWVSVDAADDDVRTFWSTLAAAIIPVAGAPAADALRRLRGEAAEAELPGAFARALGQAREPLVLVLDNLHEVTHPEVHAGLVRLLEHPVSTLSLVVTTRRDPPWPLARLRLAGLLSEIRAADLAFRADEAAILFDQLDIELGTDQLHDMVQRTEGWAAGVRLGALHVHGADDVGAAVAAFSGDDVSVSGYLLEEILDRQPRELAAFLEDVSVVDLVCADLADALTGNADGNAVLADLAASYLFVQALGRPGRWYQLHRLILDILRARPTPRRRGRDLHRRAAMWFADHGMPLDALRSALRGELWPLAAELGSEHLLSLSLLGSARELERLLAAVPRAVLLDRPELATALAGARIAQGRTTEIERLVHDAARRAEDLSPRRAQRLRLHHAVIMGAHARIVGDLPALLEAYRRVPLDPAALATLGVTDADIVPFVVHSNLGTAELWIGDPAVAESHLREATGTPGATPALPHVNASAHLALLHAERGDLVTAEKVATAAVDVATAAGWARSPQAAPAYLAMAQVEFDRGDVPAAGPWFGRLADVEELASEPHLRLAETLVRSACLEAAGDADRALDELRAIGVRLGDRVPPRPLTERWALAEATLLVRAGEADAARALAERAGPRGAGGAGGAALARARLHLHLGDAQAAGDVLRRIDAGSHPRSRVGVGVVGALIARTAGDLERALTLVEDALLTAAPFGLRRPFLAEPDLTDLLARRVERGSGAVEFTLDLIGRMTGTTGTTDEQRPLTDPLTDPLTERERTALRYLASSLSNVEIARELYVSVNTVKTHQRAVYRKLGAAGRRDAVHRARALALL